MDQGCGTIVDLWHGQLHGPCNGHRETHAGEQRVVSAEARLRAGTAVVEGLSET